MLQYYLPDWKDDTFAASSYNRKVHMYSNGLVALPLVCVGMVVIVSNKILLGKAVIPSTVHAIGGTLAFCGCLFQVVLGVLKYSHFVRTGEKIYRWHGSIGFYNILAGFIVMAFGTASLSGIPTAVAAVSVVFTVVVTVYLILFKCAM